MVLYLFFNPIKPADQMIKQPIEESTARHWELS